MIIKQKTGFIQNLTFIAIISAIIAIFALVIALYPFMFILGIVFTPLLSALTTSVIEKKYLPLFLGSATILSLAISFFNPFESIFYILPGLISGSLLSLFLTSKFPSSIGILLAGSSNILLFFLGTILMKSYLEIDFNEYFYQIFNLANNPNKEALLLLFIIVFIFAELSIVAFIILNEMKKFTNDFVNKKPYYLCQSFLGCLFLLLAIPLMLLDINQCFPLICILITSYFGISIFVQQFQILNKISNICMSFLLITGIILFTILYSSTKSFSSLYFLTLPFLSYNIYMLIKEIILRKKNAGIN